MGSGFFYSLRVSSNYVSVSQSFIYLTSITLFSVQYGLVAR